MDEIFKGLSEMTRLRILSLLCCNDMCVCEIEYTLEMAQSNASRHLTTLRKCGILECYKIAQWTYFKISDPFKQEHQQLWHYLQLRLKILTTYDSDKERYERCKAANICCKSKMPR